MGWGIGDLVPALGIAVLAAAAVDEEEDEQADGRKDEAAEEVGRGGDDGADGCVVVGAADLVEVDEEGVKLGQVAGGVEGEPDQEDGQDGVTPGEQGTVVLDDGVEGTVLEGTAPGDYAPVTTGAGIF